MSRRGSLTPGTVASSRAVAVQCSLKRGMIRGVLKDSRGFWAGVQDISRAGRMVLCGQGETSLTSRLMTSYQLDRRRL